METTILSTRKLLDVHPLSSLTSVGCIGKCAFAQISGRTIPLASEPLFLGPVRLRFRGSPPLALLHYTLFSTDAVNRVSEPRCDVPEFWARKGQRPPTLPPLSNLMSK